MGLDSICCRLKWRCIFIPVDAVVQLYNVGKYVVGRHLPVCDADGVVVSVLHVAVVSALVVRTHPGTSWVDASTWSKFDMGR